NGPGDRVSGAVSPGSGDRIRTCDLWVMSPASYRTAPPRVGSTQFTHPFRPRSGGWVPPSDMGKSHARPVVRTSGRCPEPPTVRAGRRHPAPAPHAQTTYPVIAPSIRSVVSPTPDRAQAPVPWAHPAPRSVSAPALRTVAAVQTSGSRLPVIGQAASGVSWLVPAGAGTSGRARATAVLTALDLVVPLARRFHVFQRVGFRLEVPLRRG